MEQAPTDLSSQLRGRLFLGGQRPSAADVAAFNKLLGAENTHLHRWVKHMASFTRAERATWPAAPDSHVAVDAVPDARASETLSAPSPASNDGAAALEPVVARDDVPRSSVLLEINAWEDADLHAFAGKLKAMTHDGIAWGEHKLVREEPDEPPKLLLTLVIEDEKISGEEIEQVIMGFDDEVQSMKIVSWNKA